MAIYLYSANVSMNNEAFYNSDGDFLIGLFHMNEPLIKFIFLYSTSRRNSLYHNRVRETNSSAKRNLCYSERNKILN